MPVEAVAGDHTVDKNAARFKLINELPPLACIIRPGAAAQTELRRIGKANGFVKVAEECRRRQVAANLVSF